MVRGLCRYRERLTWPDGWDHRWIVLEINRFADAVTQCPNVRTSMVSKSGDGQRENGTTGRINWFPIETGTCRVEIAEANVVPIVSPTLCFWVLLAD